MTTPIASTTPTAQSVPAQTDFPVWKTITFEGNEVDLVLVESKHLGLQHGAYLPDLLKKAEGFGLMVCPPEIAEELASQYKEQPKGQSLNIGMKPLQEFDQPGVLIYAVEFSKPKKVSCPHPQGFWGAYYRWIFIKPHK